MSMLEGKTIAITGAAGGIGRAVAIGAARLGASVAILDLDEEASGALADLITHDGGKAIGISCNVAVFAEWERALSRIIEQLGPLHGAVNNAGIPGANAFIADYPDDVFDAVMSVNVKGVWNGLKLQIPHMLSNGGGAIVNVASIGGVVGKDGQSAYIASKHAVLGLTKTAALEYGSRGIRVNAVCPGIIRTEMIDTIIAGDRASADSWNQLQPIGRMGTPEEVSEAIIWLLSDLSSLVHGHGLVADGGYTIG